MPDLDRLMEELGERSKDRFERQATLMSFASYLALLARRPYGLTRNAAQYAVDMMESFGVVEPAVEGMPRRFRVFDDEPGGGEFRVVGHERVQEELFLVLREFVNRRRIDKLILLHGPNGSAKTTLITAFIRGLESYSRSDEGILLRFNWIFSEAADRGERLGFDPVRPEEDLDSFAHLEPERISAKISCELRDNPIFLIPREERLDMLTRLVEAAGDDERARFVETRFLIEGDLSPKARCIYDSLLKAYAGDWRKVIRHVQVERYHVSKRFRSAAVTIEPQGNIDAGAREIGHPQMSGLPPILRAESLSEAHGDLIDANGGVVEYSDLLKRPTEANKYLLTTAETGEVSLPSYTAYLNLLMLGTSNENYLGAFRRDPLFSSFKSRLNLIRVPYLLSYSEEEEIYRSHLERLATGVFMAPHAVHMAALWAIMTRLMAPTGDFGDEDLTSIIQDLTPLEKAKLYHHGETPDRLGDEEAAALRDSVPLMAHEYDNLELEYEGGARESAYEGRRGCSPREMLAFLTEVAIDPPGGIVTPRQMLRELQRFAGDPAHLDLIPVKATATGFHSLDAFDRELIGELRRLIAADIREGAELVEEGEFTRLFMRYFQHLKAHETRERVFDAATGRDVDPDLDFMDRIEDYMGVEGDADAYRSGLMARAASAKIADPEAPLDYPTLFAAPLRSLTKSLLEERDEKLKKVAWQAMIHLDAAPGRLESESIVEAEHFSDRMAALGYEGLALIEALEIYLD